MAFCDFRLQNYDCPSEYHPYLTIFISTGLGVWIVCLILALLEFVFSFVLAGRKWTPKVVVTASIGAASLVCSIYDMCLLQPTGTVPVLVLDILLALATVTMGFCVVHLLLILLDMILTLQKMSVKSIIPNKRRLMMIYAVSVYGMVLIDVAVRHAVSDVHIGTSWVVFDSTTLPTFFLGVWMYKKISILLPKHKANTAAVKSVLNLFRLCFLVLTGGFTVVTIMAIAYFTSLGENLVIMLLSAATWFIGIGLIIIPFLLVAVWNSFVQYRARKYRISPSAAVTQNTQLLSKAYSAATSGTAVHDDTATVTVMKTQIAWNP
eukprot:GILJ01002279.1.p1 GENE.GILJ01002279.1~~GILJ01002279.1.p1  ORF type:complete len:346 (+),score=24.54 GILJ01002279.1:78-1040(+)